MTRLWRLLLCVCILPVSAAAAASPDARRPAPFVLALLQTSAGTAHVERAHDAAHLPMAIVGQHRSALVGMPVVVDGSASHDASGRRIVYEWSIIEAPTGSVAALDAADPTPVLVPDMAGVYRIQLVVVNEAGLESVPAGIDVVAFDQRPAPNAWAGRDRSARVGSLLRLDAGGSFDLLDTPLTFAWSLISAPTASRIRDADILLRNSATPLLMPDAPGPFVLGVEASNGERAARAQVTIRATEGNLPPVAYAGNHQIVGDGRAIVLHGEATLDPDAGPARLAFAWTLVARPSGSALTTAAILDADKATATVTLDAPGAYVFRLQATDGDASDADNVVIRLAPAADSETTAPTGRGGTITPLIRDGNDARVIHDVAASRLSVTAAPLELRIAPGGEGVVSIRLRGRTSGPSAANLRVSGLPPGITASFARPTLAVGADTTMTLRVGANVATARYPIVVTATTLDARGSERSTQLTLIVARSVQGAPQGPTCGTADLSRLGAAIYVAPAGTDSPTCGEPASPCATIQLGIDRCASPGCSVLVRYGRYATNAPIALKNGVNVYGGCLFADAATFDPAAVHYRSIVDASPPAGTPAVQADAINTPTLVWGLAVLGKIETAAGAASIAMAANNSSGLSVQNVSLVAGKGGDGGSASAMPPGGIGSPGSRPPSLLSPVGGAGGAACSTNPQSTVGRGGQGADNQTLTADCGDWYCDCTTSNPTASMGRPGIDNGNAKGGVGGARGLQGCGCLRQDGVPDGPTGGTGDAGACGVKGGTAASPFGAFDGIRWIAGQGGTGGGGSVGAGGGGGGSGGISAYTNFSTDHLYPGLPGGGGGGGGCGGPGGTGGGQGGASIALLLANTALKGDPNGSSIVPGPAGAGGDGGRGGVGGAGGIGGTSWPGHTIDVGRADTCTAFGPGTGGTGGVGGQGGAGSGGAAGTGGPSIGIALVGGSPDPLWQRIYGGMPGAPGQFGSGGQNAAQPVVQPNPCKAVDGDKGLTGGSARVLVADQVAPAPARVINHGTLLLAGQDFPSPDGNTVLSMQHDGNLCLYTMAKGVRTKAWCTSTTQYHNVSARMTSGVLTLRNPAGVVFQAGTADHPQAYLAIRDDGKAVIVDGVTVLWSSHP